MTPAEHCLFEARMASLVEATAFVEGFCERHGVGHADTMRLLLVIEELFTNTVQHGHGGDCDAAIQIALQAQAAEVELHYEDSAPAFDGLAAAAPADLDAPEVEREPGGLGLHLVKRFAGSARYAREDGRNRLWIVLPRRP
jgi:serine/threonine-protein kinase RsbW